MNLIISISANQLPDSYSDNYQADSSSIDSENQQFELLFGSHKMGAFEKLFMYVLEIRPIGFT